ncbi:hypothetical protein E1B28_013805 [Marasmius oreades]|uniref:Uncharacterized protein n=1 Tax=Marasmius oreades TaxID=181124 RepID=A0A9P7RQK3_9AGAR|nr:uncharacterized protein E1B28_013805 [Marasmius oreades]KAG7087867.1 hypothetical protein E1B28_013805 [Marasmius oreades]
MTWFTELEDIIYAPVEYIPAVGTVYSFKRANIAYREGEWKRHWQSVSNFGWGLVRDAFLISELVEPAPVVIIHAMGEALTDKLVEVFSAKSTEEAKIPWNPKQNFAAGGQDSESDGLYHVLITGSTKEKSEATAKAIFQDGLPKGLRYFHRSHFVGRFTHETYAKDGENISLHLPNGLYPGATCVFSWKWTVDASGVANRPEHTKGTLRIDSGKPTGFGLATNENYCDFWGEIVSEDELKVKMQIPNWPDVISFEMKRVPGPFPSRVMNPM